VPAEGSQQFLAYAYRAKGGSPQQGGKLPGRQGTRLQARGGARRPAGHRVGRGAGPWVFAGLRTGGALQRCGLRGGL
jgi:hypothetical protein